MLGCLNCPCHCLAQMGTLEGAGPCHISFSELACRKTNQRATPQNQVYGQGTSQEELGQCKYALGDCLLKVWKSGPENITGGNFM